MLLLRTEKLPEGREYQYELKLDAYRAIAFKTGGKVQLRSRNVNDFTLRYAGIAKALAAMPEGYSPVLEGNLEDLITSVKERTPYPGIVKVSRRTLYSHLWAISAVFKVVAISNRLEMASYYRHQRLEKGPNNGFSVSNTQTSQGLHKLQTQR